MTQTNTSMRTGNETLAAVKQVYPNAVWSVGEGPKFKKQRVKRGEAPIPPIEVFLATDAEIGSASHHFVQSNAATIDEALELAWSLLQETVKAAEAKAAEEKLKVKRKR